MNLREIAALPQSVLPMLDGLVASVSEQVALWLGQLRQAVRVSSQRAAERIKEIEQLAGQCQEFADTDFSFLFDEARDLFAIGYNVSDQRRDNGFYDLLAEKLAGLP